jgi:hypothetical protein
LLQKFLSVVCVPCVSVNFGVEEEEDEAEFEVVRVGVDSLIVFSCRLPSQANGVRTDGESREENQREFV